MSYILEALKKAEAERKSGMPQGLPSLPPLAGMQRNPPPWRRPLPRAAFAALAITLACAAWFAVTRDRKPPPLPAPAAPAAPAIAAARPAPPTPAIALPAPAEPEAATAEAPPRPKEKPAKKHAEKKAPKQAAQAKLKPEAPPPEPSVPTLRELPEQLQREIPRLTVGGYIYSGSRADRSVLINQRLLHEGEEVAPGLVLEKMLPNGMVLNYRGQRYRTGY